MKRKKLVQLTGANVQSRCESGDAPSFAVPQEAPAPAMSRPANWQILVALLALYFVWGSTYLAICIAIETLPPFLMAGVRMLIAGAVMLGWAWGRNAVRPTVREWREATVVGAFLLLGGNGLVVWAAQKLPSGLLALLVGATPLAMVLVGWFLPDEPRPRPLTFVALALGLVGIAWLVLPGHSFEGVSLHVLSCLAALGATLSWAIGSHYARRARLPHDRVLTIAMEMVTGGVLLCLVGLARGELAHVALGRISWQSLAAMTYLVIFGSLVGFTAYIFLLEHTPPALATSYAFVNPLVAVILGWAVRGERLGPHVLIGGGLIIAAVVFITLDRARGTTTSREPETEVP